MTDARRGYDDDMAVAAQHNARMACMLGRQAVRAMSAERLSLHIDDNNNRRPELSQEVQGKDVPPKAVEMGLEAEGPSMGLVRAFYRVPLCVCHEII